jgi:hypothetical protein
VSGMVARSREGRDPPLWDELKTLCRKADVPDKSGEHLTQDGAQQFIDQLKKQIAERR